MKKFKKLTASLMALAITAAGMSSIPASAASTITFASGVTAQVGIQTSLKGKSYITYTRSTSRLVGNRSARNIHCTTNIQYNELFFPDQNERYRNLNFTVATNPSDPNQKIKTISSINGASLGDNVNNIQWRSQWLQNQC